MTDWQDGKHRKYKCILCGLAAIGFGNNPEPLAAYEVGRCCDDCNQKRVVPERLRRMAAGLEAREVR